MKHRIILSLGLLLLVYPFVCAQDGYKVIVNKNNEIKSLTLEDLYKIFTGKTSTWEKGEKIKIILQKKGDFHREFVRDIAGMNPGQFSRLWKQKIFTGRAPQLRFARNDQEVIKWVESSPQAIGYIASKSYKETVKKILIETE